MLTVGLFGTAFAWYWLFSRELVSSRPAAFLGGAFCGFAPAMISHANAHPNFVDLFLLPLIALQLIRLSRGRAGVLRGGAVLGAMITAQIGLGEEPLLIFAIAFGLFAVVYYADRPRTGLAALGNIVKPLVVAGAIAVLITGVALWWQFFGQQSYRFLDHGQMGNDAKALTQFPSDSLGGWFSPGQNVAINPTEQNAYFGWPLLALAALLAVWLWRNRVARAATVTLIVTGILSLGAELKIGKHATGLPLPWHWLGGLPLLDSVLETRFAMASVPAIAVLLVLATERVLRTPKTITAKPVTALWFTGLAFALVPLIPTPLAVVDRHPTPQYFSSGDWAQFSSGGSVVMVPLPRPEHAQALGWQIDTDFAFPIAGGYFVGPAGSEKKGKYGPDDRPTALLLAKVEKTGNVPHIDDATRARAANDLRFWHADTLVLPGGRNVASEKHSAALKATVQQLTGITGEQVDDAWVWDVRPIVSPRALRR